MRLTASGLNEIVIFVGVDGDGMGVGWKELVIVVDYKLDSSTLWLCIVNAQRRRNPGSSEWLIEIPERSNQFFQVAS
jgi:hypothetical protein